jgi:hypothetical protein
MTPAAANLWAMVVVVGLAGGAAAVVQGLRRRIDGATIVIAVVGVAAALVGPFVLWMFQYNACWN